MDDEGNTVTITISQWKVTKGALIVAKGEKIGTLYLCTNKVNPSMCVASTRVYVSLWHQRLGHMSEKGMQILHSKNLLLGLKKIDLEFCEGCVYGKPKRVRFLKVGKERKKEKLELIHSDVWGRTNISSLGGSPYYVTFIDDATRKTWVYPIKHKDDVFSTFKSWKALVENEAEKKVKCLRSDSGGEYGSKEFDNFCATNCIRRQRSTPRTPQENGVSEKMK